MENPNIIKGSHLKKIAFHGSLYMISSFLVKSGNVLLLPIYTRVLAPAEYAVFSNLMALGLVAGIFISLYIDVAYARLFFDANGEPGQLRRLFSTLFFFFVVWGLAATIAAFVGSFVGKRLLNKVTLRAVQILVGVLLILVGIGLVIGIF